MKAAGVVVCALVTWLCPASWSAAQPVLEAASSGDLARVQEILAGEPAQIAVTSQSGKSALHAAAQAGHAEVVDLLLSKGAQVDLGNVIGETPLHYAAGMGHVGAVRCLLEHGARTTARSVEGNTPLHYAALAGRPEVAQALLEAGADVNARNHYGNTPLDLALANGQQELADLLVAAGGEPIAIRAPEVLPLSGGVSRILFDFGDASNIVVAKGDEGFLLVDTGFTSRAVGELRKALQGLGGGEVRYIINTHLHRDHVAGNDIGGDRAVRIDYGSLDRLAAEGVLRQGSAEPLGTYFSLDFGGEEVRLIPHPGLHTADDLIVHFTRSGVVHMGDLLIPHTFPSITRKVDDYLAFLDQVVGSFPETTVFVGGHGPVCGRVEVARYRDMLARAAAIIREQLERGLAPRDICESGALRAYEEWGRAIPILSSRYFVDAVYNTSKDARD